MIMHNGVILQLKYTLPKIQTWQSIFLNLSFMKDLLRKNY